MAGITLVCIVCGIPVLRYGMAVLLVSLFSWMVTVAVILVPLGLLQIPLWCGEKDVAAMENGTVIPNAENTNPITRFQGRYWIGPKYPVAQALKEGDTVGSFQVQETPGHSPGHIALWREKDGVLIAGDVVVNMNLLTTVTGLHEPPTMFTSNIPQNRASIIKLAQLRPQLVCVGHGAPLTETEKLIALAKQLGNTQKVL